MSEKIRVLVVEPCMVPYIKEISSDLESLQKEVGGKICKNLPWEDPVALICKIGAERTSMRNRILWDECMNPKGMVYGIVLLVGTDESDAYISLSSEMERKYLDLLSVPQRFFWDHGRLISELLFKEQYFDIYQMAPNVEEEIRHMKFQTLGFLRKKDIQVKKKNYMKIYSDRYEPSGRLGAIFERFNLQIPDDFYGHSLSVSDVIVIRNGKTERAYYVDAIGFPEIPEFFEDEDTPKRESIEEIIERIKGVLENAEDEEEIGLSIQDGRYYLLIQSCESGYDYTLLKQDILELDGGQLDNPKLSMAEAIYDILADQGWQHLTLTPADYEDLRERAERKERACYG